MMNPENKINGINFPRNVPGNLPGNISNIPTFKPAPGPPTGINIGSFQDTTAKFKMPTSLTNIYSVDTGNSATCNLPSYKTHGLGHNVTHRPNNGYQPIPNRGGRGRGNQHFKHQRFDNSQPYSQNNRGGRGGQRGGRGNDRGGNTRGRGGRGRGRGRGGRGGGGGHDPVRFCSNNLIKESFLQDPWSHLTPRKVTSEEIKRVSDTRGHKRLFNAGTSSFK